MLICRTNIGEGRGEGVFCVKCCKNKISNLTKYIGEGFVISLFKVACGIFL